MSQSSDDRAYLELRGWVKKGVNHSWCWLQPHTFGMFTFAAAVEVQRALDRQLNIGRKR